MKRTEAIVLRFLQQHGDRISLDAIAEDLNMSVESVKIVAMLLEAKGMIKLEKKESVEYIPTDEGIEYARHGLPERQLHDMMPDSVPVDELATMHKDAKVAIGWMLKKRWIEIKDGVAYKNDAPVGGDEECLRRIVQADDEL